MEGYLKSVESVQVAIKHWIRTLVGNISKPLSRVDDQILYKFQIPIIPKKKCTRADKVVQTTGWLDET